LHKTKRDLRFQLNAPAYAQANNVQEEALLALAKYEYVAKLIESLKVSS
jgi:hypothetical protein